MTTSRPAPSPWTGAPVHLTAPHTGYPAAMPYLALLFSLAACAKADAPPAWPAAATVAVGTSQKLYDQPASSEEELLRRQGLHGVSLHWPPATDDGAVVAYRIRREGVLVATLPASPAPVYEAEAKGRVHWSIEAVDDAGQASPALVAESEHVDPSAGGQGPGLLSIFGAADGDSAILGGALGDSQAMGSLFGASDGALASGGLGLAGDPPPGTGIAIRIQVLSIEGELDEAVVHPATTALIGQLRYCAEVELAKGAAGPGSVELSARIHGMGVVEMSRVRSETLGSTAAAECMSRRLRRLTFPEAEGPTDVVVRVTVETG